MEDRVSMGQEDVHIAEVPVMKPRDPRTDAKYNLFSRVLFCWLGWLLRYGFRHDLQQSDLFAHPSEADSKKLHQKFAKYWSQELFKKSKGGTPRLSRVIFKCFWWRFVWHGLLTFAEIALNIGQALLLGQLARYFSLPCELRDSVETRNAYIRGAFLVLMSFLTVFFHAHAFLVGQMIGMLTRITMTSAIYNKILTLSQTTIGRISIGHVINLASNDVQRYDLAFMFVHFVWMAPLHTAVTTYLIYLEIGWSSFLVLALVILVIPVQFFSSKFFSKLRFRSARVTDQRIRIMNEVIVGIRVIKMYAWEYAFKRVIERLRKHEVKLIALGGIIRVLTIAFNFGGVAPFIFGTTFLVYAGTGGELTAQRVFTTLSLINILRRISVTFIVRCFFNLYEASVANARIQKLLLLEEQFPSGDFSAMSNGTHNMSMNDNLEENGYFRDSPWLPSSRKVVQEKQPVELTAISKIETDVKKNTFVKVTNLSASWAEDENKLVLQDINFKTSQESPLLSIIGAVGSGKSTMLQCLLGELSPLKGSVQTNGTISYAAQEPWIFSGTIRENITFGLPYNRERFFQVVEACALSKDIESFSNGDLTIVGERGVTLSGGQKARVNLARAVYRDADVYLLDDPLSAVDTAVGKHLFDECLRGILASKIVILVTHQVHFALQSDQLLVIKDGRVQMYGSIPELESQNIDTQQLLGLIKSKDSEDEDDEFAYKEDGEADHEDVENEEELKSPTKEKDQLSVYSAQSMMSIHSDIATSIVDKDAPVKAVSMSEEKAHGTISMSTYFNYFRAGANVIILAVVFLVFIIADVVTVVGDWWLSNWSLCFQTNFSQVAIPLNSSTCPQDSTMVDDTQSCTLQESSRFIVYASLVYSAVIIHFIRGVILYLVCINASRILHDKMFANILRTPVHFFDTNTSGRILNRFSKDVGFLDDLVPITFFTFLSLFSRFIGILAVAAAANPYLLIVIPMVIVLFLVLRWYYLKTARDVKRLEALARSPVYSHISTTLQGLPTIRIFEQKNVAFNYLHNYNNEHTKGWYLYLVTTRWFGIRLDVLTNVLLFCTVAFSIPLVAHTDTDLDPSLLGLGLTYVVSLAGMFQFCVRQSAELENQMVSTERVMAYNRLENEAPLETLLPQNKPSKSWPSEGQIGLKDVAFQYSETLPLVLKGVTFSVRPSEKVGIVGRTGAGKSSLISVLFRMAEPAGSIVIDGVDTKSIGLHDLRQKMSIIPQDPVLFSGTVRYNLDPFEEYSDAELWETLEQVQLKSAIEEMEGQLSGNVAEAGGNFSVGQRQLVCLARALLRKNKILILDEATANVDPKTDGIIQQAIREKFVDCTVLTIAHRLNTVMDSDRILVMSNGRVKEFASPYRLLQNTDSQLYKMVEKTGPEASQKLHQMALEARLRTNRKMSVY